MPYDLGSARLYLVGGATISTGSVATALPRLAAAGVDLFQLREKQMEARDVMRAAEPILAACRAAGIPFILNDRPDVARAIGADGVHVGQNDLPPQATRDIVGADAIVGVSTHSEREIDAAVALGNVLDYIAVGPVNATPTKPGRPGTGIDLVRYAARAIPIERPWFVTGGMAPDTVGEVLGAGAGRVVVVRAITEAADPVAAAAALAASLVSGP